MRQVFVLSLCIENTYGEMFVKSNFQNFFEFPRNIQEVVRS